MKRLLVLLLAGGCGLGPNADLTGLRVADGVSPYQDLGAIELCLGNDRIGPEATETGGFCVDENKPDEVVCQKDSQCASRELCSCGRCTIKYCSSNGECPALHTCSFGEHRCVPTCARDTDCTGAHETCSGGVCKAGCGTDSDCEYGEVCGSQNRCVTATCAKDGDCQATEICKVQRLPRATAEPTVLADRPDPNSPPQFTMYLEMADISGLERQIWRATSQDGLKYAFNPATPVLDASGQTHAPSAVNLPTGIRVYYETTSGITYADSQDGITFGTPVLAFSGDFHSPAAVVSAGEVILYVQIGARNGIAVWTGSGVPATVLTPASATDPVLWRNITKVGAPFAMVEETALGVPTIKLWFDAYGQESASSEQFGTMVEQPPDDSIGFASTLATNTGQLTPYPFNPVFDRIVAFLTHQAELQPAVVHVPGEDLYYLYYVGTSPDGTSHDGIGVARNPPTQGD